MFLVALMAPENLHPTPDTPGFALASTRAFQVWLALYFHAFDNRLVKALKPQIAPENLAVLDDGRSVPSLHEADFLEAEWSVEQLARACGCHRNAASDALKELADLGWIRKSLVRHKGGEFSGFWYRLLVPPTTLTITARHRYQQRLEEAEERLRERGQRIGESAGMVQDDCDQSGSPQTGEHS